MKASENPFATARVLAVRYEATPRDLAALVEHFRQLGCRAAIVGRHGSGKTTLLEDLESGIAAAGFRITRLRLDEDERTFTRACLTDVGRLGARDAILLDGAEQLSPARGSRSGGVRGAPAGC